MLKITVKIAVRHNHKWLFIKQKEQNRYRIPGGKVLLGENTYDQIKNILYEQLGVVSACLFRVNEVCFIAEVKCIAAPIYNNIIDITGIEEEKVYDRSIDSPMRIMDKTEIDLFIGLYDWALRRKNLVKEPCILFEKVCGAVTYKVIDNVRYFLLIRNESGHIGFPKGHVEDEETEEETAIREVFEETGLSIQLEKEFRHSFQYITHGNKRIKRVCKYAVYFIAKFHDEKLKIQESEISQWWLVPYKEALTILNRDNDKELLGMVNAWLNKT